MGLVGGSIRFPWPKTVPVQLISFLKAIPMDVLGVASVTHSGSCCWWLCSVTSGSVGASGGSSPGLPGAQGFELLQLQSLDLDGVGVAQGAAAPVEEADGHLGGFTGFPSCRPSASQS